MRGVTYQTAIPFGNTVLTLTTAPHGHLGSPLSRRLPWILLLTGALLTLLAWGVARQLVRARNRAEADTATIAELYRRVEGLYDEQHALAVRLQKALLPQINPDIPQVEVAADYVAGARGVDIGGDWFSAIRVGEEQFAFVVGDVSGQGVDAVAVMARARFTLRAYLMDGDSPEAALEKSSRQFDVSADGHIVTVLVGLGSWRTGELRLASAGHLPPVLLSGADADFVDLPVGPPLGAGVSTYLSTGLTLPEGGTLFCYTDGLVERRGEDVATGLDRLAGVVRGLATRPVSGLVQDTLQAMHDDSSSDDIAVLALRRRVT
jgi:serine phosphatase RsbU (regulator of sigma subunit)